MTSPLQRQFFPALSSANEALIELARRARPTKRLDKLECATMLARALASENLLDERTVVLAELEELVGDETLESNARMWGLSPARRHASYCRGVRARRAHTAAGRRSREATRRGARTRPASSRALKNFCSRTRCRTTSNISRAFNASSARSPGHHPKRSWSHRPSRLRHPVTMSSRFSKRTAACPTALSRRFTRGDRTVMVRENRAPSPDKIREWSRRNQDARRSRQRKDLRPRFAPTCVAASFTSA